jgi:UDP:flavonoid glycosyltransferase YjiC (YdhE family)
VDRTRDEDWDVRSAADAALEPIRRSRELMAIVKDLEHPDCRDDRRWSLLDAALAFGYPGIVHTPQWFERLRSHLPYAARRYASETLNAKRKSLREELQRRERPGS